MYGSDEESNDTLFKSGEEQKETLVGGVNIEKNDRLAFARSAGGQSGSLNNAPSPNPSQFPSSEDGDYDGFNGGAARTEDFDDEWYEGEEESQAEDNILRPGDHIFVWNGRWGGQSHGIILEAPERKASNNAVDDVDFKKDDYEMLVTVLTFYENGASQSNAKSKDYDQSDINTNNGEANKKGSRWNFWGGGSKSTPDSIPSMKDLKDKKYFEDADNDDSIDDYDDDDDNEYEKSNKKLMSDPMDAGDSNVINLEQRNVIKLQTLRQFCTHGNSGSATAASSTTDTAFGSGNNSVAGKSDCHKRESKKLKKYYKVRYNASRAKRLLARAGTATCIKADERGLVIARMKHLLSNPQLLPKFHKYVANDECAIVWCCTGRWVSLQGASILEILGSSHAASAAMAGGVVSQMSVTYMIPVAPGMVWLWSVPLTVAFPIVIPILVTYGLTSLIPFEVLRRSRKKWSRISDTLNRHFWAKAAEDSSKIEYFAKNCVTATNSKNGDKSKNNFVKNFFGIATDDNDVQHNISTSVEEGDDNDGVSDGSKMPYMPLNMDAGGDNKMEEKEAVNFELNAPAISKGRTKSRSERLLNQTGNLWKSVKGRWDSTRSSTQEKDKQDDVDKLWNELNGMDLRS